MAIATLIFWLGRKDYVQVPPTKDTGTIGFMPIFWYALTHLAKRKKGQGLFDLARGKFTGPPRPAHQPHRLVRDQEGPRMAAQPMLDVRGIRTL